MAARRETITVAGRDRVNSPVPEGVRIGNLIFSSLLGPTGSDRPENASAATDGVLLFDRMRGLLEAGGGTMEDIVDLSVYVMDDDDRPAINEAWVKMFPDASDRPSRHILNVAPNGTHWRFAANFIAVLQDVPADGGKLGDLVYSPLLVGRDANTREILPDPEQQAVALFQELRRWVEGLGGTTEDIGSVMVYLMGDDHRATVNHGWAAMFPDRANLPARQTLNVLPSGLDEGLFAAVATALV